VRLSALAPSAVDLAHDRGPESGRRGVSTLRRISSRSGCPAGRRAFVHVGRHQSRRGPRHGEGVAVANLCCYNATLCLPCFLGMAVKALVLLALLDYVPGKLLKSPLPKSSQASYLPESHAIYDHYLAVARFWSFIVGFAVWEVACLRADFSASDIVYVTDVLVTSVLLQCNQVSAMRLGHSSQSAHSVFVLCSFCFARLWKSSIAASLQIHHCFL
jgi:hypothetical protein